MSTLFWPYNRPIFSKKWENWHCVRRNWDQTLMKWQKCHNHPSLFLTPNLIQYVHWLWYTYFSFVYQKSLKLGGKNDFLTKSFQKGGSEEKSRILEVSGGILWQNSWLILYRPKIVNNCRWCKFILQFASECQQKSPYIDYYW